MNNNIGKKAALLLTLALILGGLGLSRPAGALTLANEPLFLSAGAQPLVMLAMSNDHQLYYKAYNDYSDIDGDGLLDTSYKDTIDYYGYFESKRCYSYTGAVDGGNFMPVADATGTNNHHCDTSTGRWSGNFLNWVTMSRMDILRKVLYGGYRSTDSSTNTILERAYVPPDNHAWGKFFSSADLNKYTPYSNASYPSGITLCNVTPRGSSTDLSQTNTTTPRLRIANGQWSDWAAQESKQCLWDSEFSSADSPNDASTSEFIAEFTVRVQACVSGLYDSQNCKTYGSSTKPVGLLQDFGDTDKIWFGLITGSYGKRKSGGVLRKNITPFADATTPTNGEVNLTDGTFTGSAGVISTINSFRISRYEYSEPGYGDASIDDCPFGRNSWVNGDCSNWGNPMGEIYLEALRYFVGGKTANFSVTDTTWIAGLQEQSWVNPYGPAVTSPARGGGAPYCAKPDIISFSTGVLGFDHDEYGGASDVPGLNVNTDTNAVGTGESINGNSWFVGSLTGGSANDTCTAQTVSNLSDVTGLCPEAAGLQGSYKIAGLAHHAHKKATDLNTVQGNQTIDTYAVALAPPIPEIKVNVGGTTVTIIPAGHNWRDNNAMVLVNFRVISQASDGSQGEFFMNYENAPAGADHDSDMKGYLRYIVSGSTIKIIMHNTGSSAGATQHMGYVIDGVSDAGTHYLVSNRNVNSNTSQGGGSYTTTQAAIDTACQGAGFAADPTTATNEQCHYTLSSADRYVRGVKTHAAGTATTGLLKSPLWYAAKWGGFKDTDSDGTPNLTSEWDRKNTLGQGTPDGIPDNYFLVTDPAGLRIAMNTTFTNILKATGTASAVAVNTATLNTESALYQAKFTSNTWSGQLLAKTIDPFTGTVAAAETWDAANKLRGQDWNTDRNIITWNPDITATRKGAKFRYGTTTTSADIGTTNAAFLNSGALGAQRLAFLRGSSTDEGAGGFRDRDDDGLDFKLGDIINSSPIFVGPPPFLYPDSLETAAYSSFRSANISRLPITYVGANDGMLHGFNACTSTSFPGCGSDATQFGLEKIAYVPSMVYPNLAELSSPAYTHRYYVDLSPTAGDVFGDFSSTVSGCTTGCWRTIVVGGLRGGGGGYFALDVTDPTQFSENNAATLALWEFTHADLGFSYSEPTITRMHNGKWAVVFGSGYTDGATGSNKASLFILDAVTGQIMSGMSGPIELDSTSNGLSTPAVVDTDGDFIADYIYAGDIKGKVWKIDVKDSDPSKWKSFYKSGSTPQPLFQAVDGTVPTTGTPTGVVQPITSRPEVGRHPDGEPGFMVYVGTGKYIETGDNTPKASPIQTFYGLWDKDPTTGSLTTPITNRNTDLLAQTISEFTSGGATYRTLSTNAIQWDGVSGGTKKGWRVDLLTNQTSSLGEMVVFKPILRSTRVIFTTLIPEQSACSFGGTGFLMELNYQNGGALPFDVFDINDDGNFNASDRAGGSTIISGMKTTLGITPDPVFIDDPAKDREIKIITGSSGLVETVANNPGPTSSATGRRSWRQLK